MRIRNIPKLDVSAGPLLMTEIASVLRDAATIVSNILSSFSS